jgi:hypothetical protein
MTGTSAPFDSEAGYRAGIALTLTAAQREVRIFDCDLLQMGLDLREPVERLAVFLAASGNRRLQIVVHDVAPLQSRQPRLLGLLRDFAHQIEVRVTPEHLRHLAECWVLADEAGGTIRFHGDHARGKTIIALPAEIKPWWQKAGDLAAESEPCIPWAVAGL